ncbi:hypothetical protein HK102_009528 [Quaeritorhiza haematococci]|nr:hypothetical protein HK102_009528 [Quaeritorhiza haematococci]
MESILEQQRRAHEECERLEQAMVEELLKKTKTHREKVVQEHRVNQYLERIQARSQYLLELYEDEDGAREAEKDAITGATEFSEFYQRLKNIKDYHRRFPNEPVEVLEYEFVNRDPEKEEKELENIFSGEEGFGKYLDMHVIHEHYLNLKNSKKLNYLLFLSECDRFDEIPKATKSTPEYAKYLDELKGYLEGFLKRTQPLYDMTSLHENTMKEFESKWETGELPGWELQPTENENASKEFYCVACEKQFAKKTVFEAHKTGKKHLKAAAQLQERMLKDGPDAVSSQPTKSTITDRREKQRPIAMSEHMIRAYMEVLSAVRDETKAHVDTKQLLTVKEREQLLQQGVEVDVKESDDEEDEDKIYNPLKLPLGWDGKPIPYWLFKLHGLGVEYPCEICGNYVYMGRKAFDRHFQEWRHAHGMRCLGIPNTRHFHEITLIEDAYALWEKLKAQTKTDNFKADTMEEFEDSEGNVFNKKTYEDLKRQGLL